MGRFSSGQMEFADPPELRQLPTYAWLLRVYGLDTLSRLEETKAQITSVYGEILKMDSTKKVRCKSV